MMYFPWGKDQRLVADQHDFDHRPYERMVRYAPNFEVKLWDYYTTEAFCLKHYPKIWKVARALPRPMMLVNTLRWLVVYHFGGISWQYDMNPLVPMERILPSPGKEARVFTEFVLNPEECLIKASEPIRKGEPEESVRVPSQAFCAVPRHRYIKSAVDLIHERSKRHVFKRDYDCQFMTGNAAASAAYDLFGKNDPTVERVPRDETWQMMKIIFQGTWRTEVGSQKSEVGSQKSGIGRLGRTLKRVVKSMPGVAAGFHRWVRPHEHEKGLKVAGCRLQVGGSSFAEQLRERGVRSVLECSFNGESVWGGEGIAGIEHRLASPTRAAAGPVSFLNPTYSRLPRVDAMLLPHYFDYIPTADIQQIIQRVRQAGIRWLWTTHYPCLNCNWDTYVGEWRPVSLELPPFSMPEPDMVIPDPDPERRPDRSLALWSLQS